MLYKNAFKVPLYICTDLKIHSTCETEVHVGQMNYSNKVNRDFQLPVGYSPLTVLRVYFWVYNNMLVFIAQFEKAFEGTYNRKHKQSAVGGP